MAKGRPKTATGSRKTRGKDAQKRFRSKKAEAGYFPMQTYVPSQLLDELDQWARENGKTRSEYVTEALKIYQTDKIGIASNGTKHENP